MAKAHDHYRKYQVYFFLYLAVICELLIIIVERDDAESDLLLRQQELEKKNRAIILELLKSMPPVAPQADNQMKINTARYFNITVGLGDKDTVIIPPKIVVQKNGVDVQTFTQTGDFTTVDTNRIKSWLLDLPPKLGEISPRTTREKTYRFKWFADQGDGMFDFQAVVGTDRVGRKATIKIQQTLGEDQVIKVGNLEFPRGQIQSAIDSDPILKSTNSTVEDFIQKSQNISSNFTISVVKDQVEQLGLDASRATVVTAVGFEAKAEMYVKGTTPDKIGSMTAFDGEATSSLAKPATPDQPWVFKKTYTSAGKHNVRVEARANRSAGALDVAKPIQFDVVVKDPVLIRKKPKNAYNNELFEVNINVAGLEEANRYAWTLSIDDKETEKGTGYVIKTKVPENAKKLYINATYEGQKYQMYLDTASMTKKQIYPADFTYQVIPPPYNIQPLFEKDGEYPINTIFQFDVDRCGRCVGANIRNVPAAEIQVTVEDENGNDLLDGDPDIMDKPTANPAFQEGTSVKFRLKAKKIKRDGIGATIKMKAGTAREEYRVTLLPAD
jgi:hypothetical protein